MPYQTTTLASLAATIGGLMDDRLAVYWTLPEITYAIWEGLRIWGGATGFWRSRGAFTLNPNVQSPWYDLSVVLPALRTRTYPLWRIVQEIQYMLLEAPTPDGTISGSGMSGQISVGPILNAVLTARNRFVLDARLPLATHLNFAPAGPGLDLVSYPASAIYIHRLYWQDTYSSIWTRVGREDIWAADHSVPWWPLTPGIPSVFSEDISPLTLQLIPPPANVGQLEAVTVDVVQVDVTNPDSLLSIPDEWVHAVKYAALSSLFEGESMIRDEMRSHYAEQRYQQALDFARSFPSVTRMMAAGVPLGMDTVDQLDYTSPWWRNYTGYPSSAAALYDLVAFNPGMVPAAYGVSADVITPAPLPVKPTDYIQLGQEDIDHLIEYCLHYLRFKCGGQEFTSTLPYYDSFLEAISRRKLITQARIRYLEPLFKIYDREQASRPDRMEPQNA